MAEALHELSQQDGSHVDQIKAAIVGHIVVQKRHLFEQIRERVGTLAGLYVVGESCSDGLIGGLAGLAGVQPLGDVGIGLRVDTSLGLSGAGREDELVYGGDTGQYGRLVIGREDHREGIIVQVPLDTDLC